ncbi:glycosyltransferase family 4 protein [Rhizobium sp. LjRoot98]|uniref:glycosyltransferase family 4 protein n=1 Tax=unclassified Rhizobium TaxID=2613769 RepID=UPI000713E163|nr:MULTISPECIES: glycosyltransferase family 4 protein [unclassified Rhizobium]KQV40677.1 glycosyl transferase [Rhizobium sp. Root1204]KQX98727.1 glycosyl transferase [Rhizobium sp. Root1334]KRC10635.1 glycosyl transferase [Rhizobium sp. Root73]
MNIDPFIPGAANGLRIVQVLEPSGGGSGRHFLDLCRGLHERGHHVEAVYSPLRAEDAFVRELKSLALPAVHAVAMKRSPGLSDIAAHRALRRIIDGGTPFDIVHGHSSKAGALTRLRLPGVHAPRVYTPHAFRTMDPTLGRIGRLIFGGIETILAKLFTDHLICVSDDEHAHALSLGMPARKLSVIINGVTTPPLDMANTVRASFGISADTFVFGFVGRLSYQKAPERLIEAFRNAASRLPGAELIMVGSGDLEPEVRTAIAESGVQKRIRLTSAFTGPQAVPAFDVLVMPSRYEAMSYVMLEAAASGKPIISTDVGGASTAIEKDKSGLIVPNDGDTAKLANAMVESADPGRYRQLTEAAIGRMANFSMRQMIDRTEAVYRRLATAR